jgi:hypothetical protein
MDCKGKSVEYGLGPKQTSPPWSTKKTKAKQQILFMFMIHDSVSFDHTEESISSYVCNSICMAFILKNFWKVCFLHFLSNMCFTVSQNF